MSMEPDARNTFEALLERARSGDPEALKELFESARRLIGDLAAQQLSGTSVGLSRPSDIAQDTSIQAYTGFDSFKGTTEGEWESWVRAILRSCIAQSRRAARQQKRDERKTVTLDDSQVGRTRSGQPSPSEVTARGEHWQQILGHIFDLPPDQKAAIRLVHLKGLPTAEAAKQMGKSEGAIGGLLYRGIETLRARMAGKKSDGSSPSTPHQEAVAALLDYLKRCEREGQVDVASFVAEHPGCADELREMIEWTANVRALRPQIVNQ